MADIVSADPDDAPTAAPEESALLGLLLKVSEVEEVAAFPVEELKGQQVGHSVRRSLYP